MKHPRASLLIGGTIIAFGAAFLLSSRAQFLAGGAMVNLGYRLQDPIHRFDFTHADEITPDDVWSEVLRQNHLAASVRKRFPRSAPHPLVAMVVCMDSRLDTTELLGDTRKYYYIVRTAGSVMSRKESEMLELAVENGVKVVVVTRHTDCAAERVAATPELRAHLPALSAAIDERDKRLRAFMDRPHVAERIAAGKLAVKVMNIDTMTEEMLPPNAPIPITGVTFPEVDAHER